MWTDPSLYSGTLPSVISGVQTVVGVRMQSPRAGCVCVCVCVCARARASVCVTRAPGGDWAPVLSGEAGWPGPPVATLGACCVIGGPSAMKVWAPWCTVVN